MYHDEDSVDIYAGLESSPEKHGNTGKNGPPALHSWSFCVCSMSLRISPSIHFINARHLYSSFTLKCLLVLFQGRHVDPRPLQGRANLWTCLKKLL